MGVIQHETAYYQSNPAAPVPFTPLPAYGDPTFATCASSPPNCAKTWGLRVVNSSNIFQYGAGLYSFFDNWDVTACLASVSCQEHMVDLQNSSNVYLWALNTVGTSYLVSYQDTDVVPQTVNQAAFAQTIALFELAATE